MRLSHCHRIGAGVRFQRSAIFLFIMTIGLTLKSLISQEAAGELVIAVQEKMYRLSSKRHPDYEPHHHLVELWISRIVATGKKRQYEEMMAHLPFMIDNVPEVLSDNMSPRYHSMIPMALMENNVPACVPPPDNARALGLYFIYKERPRYSSCLPEVCHRVWIFSVPSFHCCEKWGYR